MSFTDEYLAQKKKKKKQAVEQVKSTGHSFTDEYLEKKSSSETKEQDIAPLFVNKTAALHTDFAPVKTTVTTTTPKERRRCR